MRKITSLLLSLLLFCCMSVAVFAEEATVSTSVPSSHTLTVIAEHADVFYEGKSGDNFSVPRLSEPTLLIRPESGQKVSKVTLNGEDITDKVIGGYYTLPSVYEEKELIVETVEVPAESDSIHDISGTLTDKNGNPIAGATVDIGGKSDKTDRNGKFKIEDVPNGYYPVTVTDGDGNVISYTELEITEGELKITKNPDGTYKITAPKNSAIYMDMTVQTDGKTAIGGIKDITPPRPGDPSSPPTGILLDINLWLILTATSAGALFIIILINRRRKHIDDSE